MTKFDYQLVIQKQKNGLRAYAALCLVFLAIVGAYTYFRWIDYSTFRAAIASNESVIGVLKQEAINEKSDYLEKKSELEELSGKIEGNLKTVFPSSDDYTELTRALDSFEQELNRANNPFVIASIEYQDAQADPDGNYKYLPLRMNITSSRENFAKFLRYIETSGSILDNVRLMDIQSIHMSFNKDSGSGSGSVNFSVKINAYFQNI